MKYINIRLILSCVVVCATFTTQQASAQQADSLSLEQQKQIQVAFRTATEDELIGSVAVVDYKQLNQINDATSVLENIEALVGGWNGNSLWAMGSGDTGYLVLIDGVPRDISSISPYEVESISFMKSAASVVLYGNNATKGVIYVTTKRGKKQTQTIDVRLNTGQYVAKSYPTYLGSAEYMTLYNEALANDGLDPQYSDVEIYNYASGKNPYRYPDVDFYSSDYIRNTYNRTNLVTEISGGNDFARYYTNVGYTHLSSMYNFGEAKNNNTNRLNVRGNVDVDITDYISAYVNSSVVFNDTRSAHGNYWSSASTLRPNRVSPLSPIDFLNEYAEDALVLVENSGFIIDDSYFLAGTQSDQSNIFADYYASGYNVSHNRHFQFNTGVDFDLKNILKGLSFNSQFAYDYSTAYTTAYNNSYAVYAPTWTNINGKDEITAITKYGTDEKSGSQNVYGSSKEQMMQFSAQFNYKREFASDHNVYAMLLASATQQTISAVYHRPSSANLGLQARYDYKRRYFVDFSAAYLHSAKLAEGHRQQLSPSATIGWKVSNEPFMANSSVVDNLSLSVSASSLNSDLDIDGYYLYKASYNQTTGSYYGWADGALCRTVNAISGSNIDLTFVKRNEISANINTSLWDNLITLDASAFISEENGLVIQPSTIFPNYYITYYPSASMLPYVNYNNNRRIGFDFALNLNKRVGQVDLSLGFTGTYYDAKATRRSEIYEDEYQNRQGTDINAIWGLQSIGFFESEQDILDSPDQAFGDVAPGDIKYVDQNEDGVIDSKDQVFLAKNSAYGAPLTMGLNFTAKWKNLSLFALCTANYLGNAVKNNSYWWVSGDDKYSEVVRGRWTEETKDIATYPRLTTGSGANNFQTSDFWVYSTDRFDIAKVQLTYDFPKHLFAKGIVKGLSAYVNGNNLLTIAKEKEVLELSIYAPQTRLYTVGFNVKF